MIFTKRIKTISSLINKCDRVLDIGSDHGYLPIFLLLTNKCKFVCSSDISENSVLTAEKNFNRFKINKDKYKITLSDGFKSIENINYDYVIITGLGSDSILNILKNRFNNIKYAVLGSQKNTWKLRQWCNKNQISIINEKLIKYGLKFYEYIKIDFNKKLQKKYSKTEIYIGPILCQKKTKMLYKMCASKLAFYKSLYDFENKEEMKYINLFLKKYDRKK